MPTPVSAARQCLTAEAARAIDDAVAVARRRGHTQTSSLHVVSALLAATSTSQLLRDACARARSSAFSPRLQLRALDLCLAASLDRLPSSPSQSAEQEPPPPVSNSLMAAIKRSQAIQRRSPGHYHYHQLQQDHSPTSVPVVKVELRQLVLSILDDPVVSRVFTDAGFRSADVKLAILRPVVGSGGGHHRLSRPRLPPLFLCNFAQTRHGAAADDDLFDDSLRRTAEVLTRIPRRNPLLVGGAAREAVANFRRWVEGPNFIPELAGLKFAGVEREVAEGSLRPRLDELAKMAATTSGVVVDIGDLQDFPDGDVGEAVVGELTRPLELHQGGDGGRLWLLGSAASYEVYMKFLRQHQVVEKDWNFQLLPITSVRNGVGILQSRPSSLMESFVPFGGFFPMASDLKLPLSGTSITRCPLCDEKYEQEVSAFVKETMFTSTEKQQASLPSWLRKTDVTSMTIEQDPAKANNSLLLTKIMELQKKWNDICLHHQSNQILESNTYMVTPRLLPGIVGFSHVANEERTVDSQVKKVVASYQRKSELENVFFISAYQQKMFPSQNDHLSPKVKKTCMEGEGIFKEEIQSYSCNLSDLTVPDHSASSATTVTTDLMLGTNCIHVKEHQKDESGSCKDLVENCTPLSSFEVYSNSVLKHAYCLHSSLSSPKSLGQDSMDAINWCAPGEFKSLWRSLGEKVGRQQAAICAISQTITHCKSGNLKRHGTSLKGDIWLSFVGPDKFGKKKVAEALAEVIFGSRSKLISMDLNSQYCGAGLNMIFEPGQQLSDPKFRGQTVIDYIAGEISKKPQSVVFLENVDKADILLQNCLTWAVKTGKFRDSYGREVGINNTIFVTTVGMKGENITSNEDCLNITEERVLAAQVRQLQILVGCSSELHSSNCLNALNVSEDQSTGIMNPLGQVTVHKRKLEEFKQIQKAPNLSLDLNLPLEEMEVLPLVGMEATSNEYGDKENDYIIENSETWLEEFFHLIDQRVDFEPFDFDALASKLLRIIKGNFQKSFGSKGSLEIDSRCMEQILAAVWACDAMENVKVWIDEVLGSSFAKAQERCRCVCAPRLKLVASEKCCTEEEQFLGIHLPAQILLK